MKTRIFVHASLLMIIFLGACQSQVTSTTEIKPTITPPSPPERGMATVLGQVISEVTGEPIVDIAVFLPEVVRQGDQAVYVFDGAFSPGDLTDEQGYFIIENVESKEYVIMIGDVNSKHEIIAELSGEAKVWMADPDQILEIGVLEVKLVP
ncbi:MAG TPA: hypothetical protein ENI05_03945 [Porticoccus sp.]|nr:hypothetical protein [Porticoccus sp.]